MRLSEIFNIVNFDFSEEFNSAVEAKQTAQQNAAQYVTMDALEEILNQRFAAFSGAKTASRKAASANDE